MSLGTACSPGDVPRGASPSRQAEAAPPVELRLLLLPDLEGVLEPCGCSALEQGGIDRLAVAVDKAASDGVPTLLIATGRLFDVSSSMGQAALKREALVAALKQLRVQAVLPSPEDLAEAAADLERLEGGGVTTVAARGRGASDVASLVVAVGNLRVGLINGLSATGDEALAAEVALLRALGARRVVVVGAADVVPAVVAADLLIASGAGGADPRAQHEAGVLRIAGGQRASGLWSVEVKSDAAVPQAALDARFVPLTAQDPRDPALRRLLDTLHAAIGKANREHDRAPATPAAGAPSYVGAKTCAACHTEAYFWWRATPHGQAYATLTQRARQLDLDCVPCHVTGFGRPGGSTLSHLEELEGVGCESCHGPGSRHVDNPSGRARPARGEPTKRCQDCHDTNHSPTFEVGRARSLLLAPGRGGERVHSVAP